jgi:hypothetical protein
MGPGLQSNFCSLYFTSLQFLQDINEMEYSATAYSVDLKMYCYIYQKIQMKYASRINLKLLNMMIRMNSTRQQR